MGEPIAETTEERPRAPEQPLLAFVHIPRTGGGTLSSAISENYGRLKSVGNFQRNPARSREGLENVAAKGDQWKAVGDHVPLGLFRRYLPAETRYITILREPVDRVLSHYHFHAQTGEPPGSRGSARLRRMWELLLNNERTELGASTEVLSLEEDAEFSLDEGLRLKICIYDNLMTRFLCGGESIYGELPPDALDRAKENVTGLWFVALRERLDESIILLGRELGAGLMPYNLRHVSKRRPPIEETSEQLRELVAEHNALDVELYRFARERFEESAPSPGELADEVEHLRLRSAEVTDKATTERSEQRTVRKQQQAGKKGALRRGLEAELAAEGTGTDAGAKPSKAERRGKKPKTKRQARKAEAEAVVGGSTADPPSDEQ